MSLAENILQKQRDFEATGDFTSEEPIIVGELDPKIFTEAQLASPGGDEYRLLSAEGLIAPALTRFRRITGAHSAAAAGAAGVKVFRYETEVRAGIISSTHWTAGRGNDGKPARIIYPHIDDYFSMASLGYFGVTGQHMLHYPGEYTLNLEKLREEGYKVGKEIFKLWEKRTSYKSFAFEAGRACEDQLTDLYRQQVEKQGVEGVEAPSGLILVTDNHFLHSEGDHSKVVGSFRGLIRRLVVLLD